MFKEGLLAQFRLWAWLTLLAILLHTKYTTSSVSKRGCPAKCGNLTVPYPFGIGLDGECSIGRGFNINCNTSYDPPKAFIGNREILDISLADAEIRARMYMASKCYRNGDLLSAKSEEHQNVTIDLSDLPFVLSNTANKFTVIGCDDFGVIGGPYGANQFVGGVISMCYSAKDVNNGSCSGSGCSQTSIPKGLKGYVIELASIGNHTNVSSFDNCSHAFLGEHDKYTFNFSDLSDPGFKKRTLQKVPTVLDWTVGGNLTCEQAKKNMSSYACKQNSICIDYNVSTEGYRCNCQQGYEGNPYLGCTDIDECVGPNNPCFHKCQNIPGSQTCSCRKGYRGDGYKNGSGCTPRFLQEASFEQLYTMANLITKCLSVRGDDRPTMKEVAIELQGLKSQIKHLLGEQKYNSGSKDVHPRKSSTGYNPSTADSSGQYSQQRDMIIEMNHPR